MARFFTWGCNPKKTNATANFKFGIGFFGFFGFLQFFHFGQCFWFYGFLLSVLVGYNSFCKTFPGQGSVGIECVIGQFLASQDHIVDTIFEWLEFLVEVQTKKTEKVPRKKTEKKPKKTERYCKFQIWDWFFRFFQLQPPPPLAITRPSFTPTSPYKAPI